MRNSTKFGSPKLDTPNLRYEFLKHAFKSGNINQKFNSSQTDSWCPRSMGPARQTHRSKAQWLTGESSSSVRFLMVASTPLHSTRRAMPRAGKCARFARTLTGSSSPVVMADNGSRAVVCRCPPATICSGEVLYIFVVTYQS